MDSGAANSHSRKRRHRHSLRDDVDDSLRRYGLSWRKLSFGLLAALIAVAGLLLARPQDAVDTFSEHVHYGWFKRSFIKDQLEHWYAAAVTENGFFHPNLDERWQHIDPRQTTLVAQSRLLYVMASGYETTRETHYLEAMRQGADFMLRHMRNPRDGRWVTAADSTGKALDDKPSAENDAAAIFALANAYRLARHEPYRAAAIETWKRADWDELQAARAFARQGALNQDDSPPIQHNHNGLLHLFEALLALYEVTNSADVRQDIESIARFVTRHLYQPATGNLPWQFDRHWQALDASAGGNISLGHQIGWAYLLSHAALQGLVDGEYPPIAQRMLDRAIEIGYDAQQGGIAVSSHYDGSIDDRAKPAWAQAELLRALLHFATIRGRHDLWPRFDQTLAWVQKDFIDETRGGWFEQANARKNPDPRARHKSDVDFTGYHVTNLYREALALHEQRYLATHDELP